MYGWWAALPPLTTLNSVVGTFDAAVGTAVERGKLNLFRAHLEVPMGKMQGMISMGWVALGSAPPRAGVDHGLRGLSGEVGGSEGPSSLSCSLPRTPRSVPTSGQWPAPGDVGNGCTVGVLRIDGRSMKQGFCGGAREFGLG